MPKNSHDNDGLDGIDAEEAAAAKARTIRYFELFMLGVVLLLAALVRFTGLGWGLPNALHTFSYHPDETVLLLHTCPSLGGINVFSDHIGAFILPHFYNYGSLQLYLINIATSFASGYGYIGDIFTNTAQFNTASIAHFYLVGRMLTALMGIATVWVVFAAAKRLWGYWAGWVSAGMLAVMPLHAQHSHFMTVDVPATFWVALSLYWSIRVLKDENLFAAKPARASSKAKDAIDASPPIGFRMRRANPWIMAGIFAGLAMATKYNAALVILPLFAAGHFRRDENRQGALKGMAAGLTAFVIAFAIACPGSLLETHTFLKDIAFEGRHVYHRGEPEFQNTGLGWVYIVTHNLSAGMGWPLLILSAIAVGYALWRHRPEDWLLLAFALPYYVLVGAAQSRYARYEIPLLPVLALWVGALTPRSLPLPTLPAVRRIGIAAVALVLACVYLSAYWSMKGIVKNMTHTDSRDQVIAQLGDIRAHTYGFATKPWFYTPPLDPEFTLPGPGQWISMQTRWPATHLLFNRSEQFDATYLRESKPDIVLLSEFEYAAPLRLRDPNALAYIDELRRSYNAPVVCGDPVAGIHVSQADGLPVQDLPHDMLYTCPKTLIFTRKPSD